MNEFYWVCSRKARLAQDEVDIRRTLEAIRPLARAPFDLHTHAAALRLREQTNFGWWDCNLLASALAARCEIFLSEDLQDGAELGQMRIVNPFHTRPEAVLGG